MNKKDIVLITIVAIVFAILAFSGIVFAQDTQARKNREFNHSQCQYPYRTTNPTDGCDNSDPCNPAAAAKGQSGKCE